MSHYLDKIGNLVRDDGQIVILASDLPQVRALLSQPDPRLPTLAEALDMAWRHIQVGLAECVTCHHRQTVYETLGNALRLAQARHAGACRACQRVMPLTGVDGDLHCDGCGRRA